LAEDNTEDWSRHTLESPSLGHDGEIDWDIIWLYRRKNGVLEPRPVFTGDVFRGVHAIGDDPETQSDIVILQHPCALRTDGNDLRPVLVAARLVDYSNMPVSSWAGNYDVMPLVVFKADPPKPQAASFDQLVLVKSSELVFKKRVACMTMAGIALLLQRWTNMNTRVVVPTWRFTQVTALQVAEADGIEDWCQERQRARVKPEQSAREATKWLDDKNEDTGVQRRMLLRDPVTRKGIIRRMGMVAREFIRPGHRRSREGESRTLGRRYSTEPEPGGERSSST
jgi:hypothetical protein